MKNLKRNKRPSLFSERLLEWCCKSEYIEEILGDLAEYREDLLSKPRWKRKLFYWFHVFNFLKPWAIKPFEASQKLNQYGMFKNYFKIAWRNLLRQRTYSVINIGGLSVGLTCFILMFLYVKHETSYDKFYTDANRIFRIYKQNKEFFYRGSNAEAVVAVSLAPTLRDELPEVEAATTLITNDALLTVDKNHYYEEGLSAEPNYFSVFNYSLILGNASTALKSAESIIITESLSNKVFGKKNPLGKEIVFNKTERKIVTGVMEDVPVKSSIKFSYITSLLSNVQYNHDIVEASWNNHDYHVFVKLKPKSLMANFKANLASIAQKYHPLQDGKPSTMEYVPQPISDLHLNTYLNFDIGKKGNPENVKLFSLIAILVLILACVNYTNLAIARSIKRSKEVGLRKVIGAVKRQLVTQFITESIFITVVALILALILSYLLMPVFGVWLESPIETDFHENVRYVPWLIVLVMGIGGLSGSYPAFFISSLKPVDAFKGKIKKRGNSFSLHSLLILVQYTASIVLIIGSLVIHNQFKFIQSKELGYDMNQIIVISVKDWDTRKNIGNLRAIWAQNPNIISVTTASELPVNVTSGTMARRVGMHKKDRSLIYRARVDYDYIDHYGLELLAGRGYSKGIIADVKENRVINESAARMFGYEPQEAIGKTYIEGKTQVKTIVGVVKDFHMHSMHMNIAPLLFEIHGGYFDFISIKVSSDDLPETIKTIENDIKAYSPYPFDFKFLDDRFDQLYKSEHKLSEMFGVFTVLAVLVASLGLFGLAAFTTGQRTKEIGVRKVLGASLITILKLLTGDFSRIILLAFILSIPIGSYLMNGWLDDFAYRIEISWSTFVLAGLIALVIAIATISSHSIKVAVANPINSLRDE